MSPKFLLTSPLPGPGPNLLSKAGELTVLESTPTYEELSGLLESGDYDVVITQLSDSIDKSLLEKAKIKGVANYAVGFDNIDVQAAQHHNIQVTNTPGVLTEATADIAMGLILATGRRFVESDAFLRAGHFTGWAPELLLGQNVSGQVLGLAGFGRIARATAKRALAFNMDVIFSPRPPKERAVSDEELGEFFGKVRQVSWDVLVEESDYLSLHIPLASSTHHLVDIQVLERMKPQSILINTARGPIVDENALVVALRNGVIAGAGLDVYENEPLLTEGLAQLKNTVLLPHIGSATGPVRSEMSRIAAINAIEIANSRKPPNQVHP